MPRRRFSFGAFCLVLSIAVGIAVAAAAPRAFGVDVVAGDALPVGLDHLALSPNTGSVAAGTSQTYAVDGFDADDNPLGDLTTATTFSISPDGSCTGAVCSATAAGPHTVTATSDGVTATATLDITAAALDHLGLSPSATTVPANLSQAYTAEGLDAFNNSLGDVTSATTFSIDPNGSCTGAACSAATAGPHTVTATNSGVTATATLTVTPGPLDHLTLSPPSGSVTAHAGQVYTAEGFDAEGNSLGDVTASTTFAIAPNGSCRSATCSATVVGPHTVTATNSGVTATATLTVTPGSLDHLVVSPPSVSLAPGTAQAYRVEGFDADNNSLGDVTDASTFTIAPNGSCTSATCSASAAGVHTVTATDSGRTGRAALTVISPRVVFSSARNGGSDIYVMRADGTGQQRLTVDRISLTPTWSPDGRQVAFSSAGNGNTDIYLMQADGTNQKRLTTATAADTSPSWSPDGKQITFSSARNGNTDIYLMQADGTNQKRLTTATGSDAAPKMDPSPSDFAPSGGSWRLSFNDDFNGTSLDRSRWATCYPRPGDSACSNTTNGEAQWYRPGNVVVGNREAQLVAKRERYVSPITGQAFNYTSGLIQSKPSFNFTYGYLESRMWVPRGSGFWPAFWTWSTNESWPPEIDVMEFHGDNPRLVYQSYHGGCSNAAVPSSIDWTSGWHTFAADWEPGSVKYYVDGQLQMTTTCSPDQPMYLIANLAIASGTGAPSPDAATALPSRLRIDYIRVWQH